MKGSVSKPFDNVSLPWHVFETGILPLLHTQDIHNLRLTCKGARDFTNVFATERDGFITEYLNSKLPELRQDVWMLCAKTDPAQGLAHHLWICVDVVVPFTPDDVSGPFVELTLAHDLCSNSTMIYTNSDLVDLMNTGVVKEVYELTSPSIRHALTQHALYTLDMMQCTEKRHFLDWKSFENLILICCGNGWSYDQLNEFMVCCACKTLRKDIKVSRQWAMHSHAMMLLERESSEASMEKCPDVFVTCATMETDQNPSYADDALSNAKICSLAIGIRVHSMVFDTYVEVDAIGRVHVRNYRDIVMDDSTMRLTNMPNVLAHTLVAWASNVLGRTDLCQIASFGDYEYSADGQGFHRLMTCEHITEAEYRVLRDRCLRILQNIQRYQDTD